MYPKMHVCMIVVGIFHYQYLLLYKQIMYSFRFSKEVELHVALILKTFFLPFARLGAAPVIALLSLISSLKFLVVGSGGQSIWAATPLIYMQDTRCMDSSWVFIL